MWGQKCESVKAMGFAVESLKMFPCTLCRFFPCDIRGADHQVPVPEG